MRARWLWLALSWFPAALSAQTIVAQTSGLVAPQHRIDFGSGVLPNFTPVTTQFAGITVTHASYFTTGSINGLVGGFLTNNSAAGQPNTLRIQFAAPISAVSFVYHQVGQARASVFRALLQGAAQASFSNLSNQSQPNNRFGFAGVVCDEVQIDFDTDFNLDTLDFNDVGAACATIRNATTAPNPNGYTTLQRPVMGSVWQAQVATSASTIGTYLAFALGGQDPGTAGLGGQVLVQTSPAPILVAGGSSYSFLVPTALVWVGYRLSTQALRLDSGPAPQLVLLNAIDWVVGS